MKKGEERQTDQRKQKHGLVKYSYQCFWLSSRRSSINRGFCNAASSEQVMQDDYNIYNRRESIGSTKTICQSQQSVSTHSKQTPTHLNLSPLRILVLKYFLARANNSISETYLLDRDLNCNFIKDTDLDTLAFRFRWIDRNQNFVGLWLVAVLTLEGDQAFKTETALKNQSVC